jgi:hypothetical protein
MVRATLMVAAVIVCHLMRWDAPRFWTSEAVLRLCGLVAVPMQRVAPYAVRCHGDIFTYTVGCTFIDVCAGAMVLLWNRNRALTANLATMVGIAAAMFAFNITRLTLGFVLYVHSVPWALAHEAMAGLAYFLVWIYLAHQIGDPIGQIIERAARPGHPAVSRAGS